MAGCLALLLIAAGCGAAETTPTAPATPSLASDPALLQQRRDAGIADCPAATDAPPVAGGLPDIVLECLGGGGSVRLTALAGHRPMVINFWASWCGPCRAEAPHLLAVQQHLRGKVDFLGIDSSDPRPEGAIEFAREAGWPWPQVSDPESQARTALSAPGLPHTVLVDAQGRVVAQHIGQITSARQLSDLIEQHLGVRA